MSEPVLMEEGLKAFVATRADIVAKIAGRFYPRGKVPDKATTPYVTYAKVSGAREETHGGDAGLAHPRYSVTAWSPDYREAKLVARAIVKAFNGFRGSMGGVDRVSARVENEVDMPYRPEEGYHQVVVDVILWHSEP